MVVDAKQKASQHRKKKYPQSAEEVTRPNKRSGRNRGNKYYDKDEKSLLRRQIDTELRVQVAVPQTCYEMNGDKYCNYYSSHEKQRFAAVWSSSVHSYLAFIHHPSSLILVLSRARLDFRRWNLAEDFFERQTESKQFTIVAREGVEFKANR